MELNKFNQEIHDYGFIRLIDYMGDDNSIVQAARCSYGDGTKTVQEDRQLIRYLMRHKHTTPFEMVEFKFHLKMPIFVARQWLRHRTASVNELSARYSILPNEMYIPDHNHLGKQSTNNKQGTEGNSFNKDEKDNIVDLMEVSQRDIYADYNNLLSRNVSRELARTVLPVATYTEFYWKIDLHNLMHFLKLRMNSHAQQEIQDYAIIMYSMIKNICPISVEAFDDYTLHSEVLSREELNLIKKLVNIERNAEELKYLIEYNSNLTSREKQELLLKLDIK